jgi:hypothetical protein
MSKTIVFFLAVCILFFIVSDRIAARHYAAAQAAPSALDMALESRTTPPAESGGRGGTMIFGAGILALAVVVFGGAILAMTNGGQFLRQARLSRKRQSRPRPSLTITGPETHTLPQLPAAPQLRRIQPIEEGYYQE